ncbi:Core-2/I-branching beta-1 [Abeliophyllum distichum]|uniref:Core-2/I-branching beta-1 n=1 Tax=Abeliophyllum distichum TaxID=126358 RepID=A0ABD1P9M8_9LAMI
MLFSTSRMSDSFLCQRAVFLFTISPLSISISPDPPIVLSSLKTSLLVTGMVATVRHMLPDIRLADWRKGSQWFELNRALAVKIVADTKYYTLFKKYCRPSCYPDEHFIPTYLRKFFSSLNANRTVTHVVWSLGGPHHATFTAGDITENFMRSIRKNGTLCSYNAGNTRICYLFARKFDPSALQPFTNRCSQVYNNMYILMSQLHC